MLDLETIDQEAERIVKDIGIPPCPTILTKLLKEMREDEPDFARLGKLIGGDVSLAAAMLKTVNSPFFGLPKKATSIQQALALLGLRNVAQLVTGLLLRQAFPVAESDTMERFWETSSGTALVTAHLARALKYRDRDEAYTFALFRDCGVALMTRKFRDYGMLMRKMQASAERSVTAIEDQHYTINHARIGYQLAKSWMLPEDTCLAILLHHDYARLQGNDDVPVSSRKLVALALAAEWLYNTAATGTACPEWALGSRCALEILGVTEQDLEAQSENVRAALAQQ